jgi:hypothetical protein
VRAEIFEDELQLGFDMLVSAFGYADTAGICQGFQPRGDVDAVAKQFAAIDHHIADVDANPKLHLQAFWQVERLFGNLSLDLNSSPYRFDGARKFDHDAVAGAPEYAAVVIGDDCFDRGAAYAERRVRSLLIPFHEAAVSRNIGSEDGGEPAFHGQRSFARETSLPAFGNLSGA